MKNHLTKIALITGPTSGIGKCFAYELARNGYGLILVARNKPKLDKEARKIRAEFGVEVVSECADLSDEKGIVKIQDYISSLKRLDLLINNAGFGVGGYFMEVPFDEQMRMLNVHLSSTIRFCRAAIPVMTNNDGGRIINVASFAAFFNLPGSVLYTTTKAAVVSFSKALQLEVEGYGIKVQVLTPGFTQTSFHKSINRDVKFLDKIPSFLWTSPESVVSTSLKCLDSKKVICIPGSANKTFFWLNQHPLISGWIQKIAIRISERKQLPVPLPVKETNNRKELIKKKVKEELAPFI